MASLSVVQLQMLTCGEREAMVMAPPPMHDSAVSPCFHSCLAFLHRHFPSQSLPSHPLDLSLQSTATLALGLLHIPQTPAPSHWAYQGTLVPVWSTYGCGKGCPILILFRLPQSDVSLSALNVSPLTQTIAPMWGSDTCFSSPTCQEQV